MLALRQQQLILNDLPMKIHDFGMSIDVQTPLRKLRKQVLTDLICVSWKLKVLECPAKPPTGEERGGGLPTVLVVCGGGYRRGKEQHTPLHPFQGSADYAL